MHKEIPISIKNQEIIESLVYNLRITFCDVKFSCPGTGGVILIDYENNARLAEINAHIHGFVNGISKMVDKVSPKIIVRHAGKRGLAGVIAAGNLRPTAIGGVYAEVAEMAETMMALDMVFLRFARRYNAVPVEIPALISTGDLEKAGYLPKDTHQVGRVTTFDNAGHSACLSPAGCLPLYPMLGKSAVALPPTAFSAMCRVFRYEGGNFDRKNPFARLWEFRVREIIFLDDEKSREARKAEFIEFMSMMLRRFDITFEISTATDIFFNPEYAKQTLFQLLNGTKIECRAMLNGEHLSIASFNVHADHFVSQFNIRTVPDKLGTFCIGFGMERFAGVLLLAYPDRAERMRALEDILYRLPQGPVDPL